MIIFCYVNIPLIAWINRNDTSRRFYSLLLDVSLIVGIRSFLYWLRSSLSLSLCFSLMCRWWARADKKKYSSCSEYLTILSIFLDVHWILVGLARSIGAKFEPWWWCACFSSLSSSSPPPPLLCLLSIAKRANRNLHMFWQHDRKEYQHW